MKQQTKIQTKKEQSGNKQETRGTKAGWEKDPRKTGGRTNAGNAQKEELRDVEGLDIDEEETAGNRRLSGRQAGQEVDEDEDEDITAETAQRGARADKPEWNEEDEEEEIEGGSTESFNPNKKNKR